MIFKLLNFSIVLLPIVSGTLLHKCAYSDKDITVELNKSFRDDATVIFYKYVDFFDDFKSVNVPDAIQCEEKNKQWLCNYKDKSKGDFTRKIDNEHFNVFNMNETKNYTQEVSEFGFYCITANYTEHHYDKVSNITFNQKSGFADKDKILDFKQISGGLLSVTPLVLIIIPGIFIEDANDHSMAALGWIMTEFLKTLSLYAYIYSPNVYLAIGSSLVFMCISLLAFTLSLQLTFKAMFYKSLNNYNENFVEYLCAFLPNIAYGLFGLLTWAEVVLGNPLSLIVSRISLFKELLPHWAYTIPYYSFFFITGCAVIFVFAANICRRLPIQGYIFFFMMCIWVVGYILLEYFTYTKGTGIIENFKKEWLYFFYTNWSNLCITVTFIITAIVIWSTIYYFKEHDESDIETGLYGEPQRFPSLVAMPDDKDKNLFQYGPRMLDDTNVF